jgi:hypothetical protein
MDKTIDNLLQHKVSKKELNDQGLSFNDLGINLRLEKSKSVYFDNNCIVIEMKNGTYLNAKDMAKYVSKRKGTCTYSESEWRYDGVVGWIRNSNSMRDAP